MWAHKGSILFKKSLILITSHKIMNKNVKIVNLEILKVKTWFGDKDLFSYICSVKPMILQKLINSLIRIHYFIKLLNFLSTTDDL